MNSLKFELRFLIVILSVVFVGLGIFVSYGLGRLETTNTVDDQGTPDPAPPKVRVLIVDGQNNHGAWPKTTEMMRGYLLETGRFTVDLARTAPKGTDEEFSPDFSKYDVVISNYNGAPWPEKTQSNFEAFVANGGGFVVIHAANNAFPEWPAYNRMIGLGGWGGRNESSGPYLYFNQENQVIRNADEGPGGSHGPQHEFIVKTRNPQHPIMQGIPDEWLHTNDELYDKLRGPAENIEVLATSFAPVEKNGTDRHEPMVMVVNYEKGRVFHTTLGHETYSMECVGFITLLQRGTEWAATGNVTLEVPQDFPTAEKTSARAPKAPAKSNSDELEISAARLGKTNKVSRAGNIFLSGQMTPDDADEIKEQNIKCVISLRHLNEVNWDEAEWAKDCQLDFHQFSCQSPSELTSENLEEIFKLLDTASPDERVLLHCGGAARVGAVWALYRTQKHGVSPEKAIEEGLKIGMPNRFKSDIDEILNRQD
jgi:type 1 glutamine amidotransferase/protein tyrosine phosphatase (PTP) superfamily phosphohydrolase (DUF442 family)